MMVNISGKVENIKAIVGIVGGALVVSLLPLNYDDPTSNPDEVLILYVKIRNEWKRILVKSIYFTALM